jgi:hypothetical protein
VKKRGWQQLNQINEHGIAKVKLQPSHAEYKIWYGLCPVYSKTNKNGGFARDEYHCDFVGPYRITELNSSQFLPI